MKKIILILSILFSFNVLNAQVVSYKENSTNTSGINDALNNIYDSFNTPCIYLYSTNKFNSSSSGFSSSKFTNIGNISTFEYTRIGGNSSYLVNQNEYFSVDNNIDKMITSTQIKNVTSSDVAGIRPSVYVKKGVKVTGSGRKDDPWIFVEPNFYVKINLINATINDSTEYKENIKDYDISRTLNVVPSLKSVLKKAECTNNQSFDLTDNILTLSNINSSTECTIEYEIIDKTFAYKEEDQEYEIQYDGYYTLEGLGAQGNGEGGLGGNVKGVIYLTKGTKLIINTGGINGYNGGGAGKFNGGGASTIKLNNEIILAAAGGGGGKDGTAGGSGNGEGGIAASGEGTNGGAGTAGTNSGGGGSGYDYSFEGNCSECYTGHNTCTGGQVEYNCSSCYTGSPNQCIGGNEPYTYNHASGTITYNCTSNGWAGTGTNNVICNSGDNKTFSCTGTVPTGACTLGSTTSRPCSGYCTGQRWNSCLTTRNTCAYGCDTRYDECATGENTCEYGCDKVFYPYNSGFGGENVISDEFKDSETYEGIQSGNGIVKISFKESK